MGKREILLSKLMLVENLVDQIDVVLQGDAIVVNVLENHLLRDRFVLAQQVEQSRSGRYGLHAQVEQLSNEPVVIFLQRTLVGGIEVFVQILVSLLACVVLVEVLQEGGHVFQ